MEWLGGAEGRRGEEGAEVSVDPKLSAPVQPARSEKGLGELKMVLSR